MPQIPLDFATATSTLDLAAGGLTTFALEVDTAPLLQALKRISAQPRKAEWLHLEYRAGMLVILAGDTSLEVHPSGRGLR